MTSATITAGLLGRAISRSMHFRASGYTRARIALSGGFAVTSIASLPSKTPTRPNRDHQGTPNVNTVAALHLPSLSPVRSTPNAARPAAILPIVAVLQQLAELIEAMTDEQT